MHPVDFISEKLAKLLPGRFSALISNATITRFLCDSARFLGLNVQEKKYAFEKHAQLPNPCSKENYKEKP